MSLTWSSNVAPIAAVIVIAVIVIIHFAAGFLLFLFPSIFPSTVGLNLQPFF